MKLLAALLLIGATTAPAFAGHYSSNGGWAEEKKCYRTEYSEEYVPGTSKFPGYVKTNRKKVRIPCRNGYNVPNHAPHPRHEEQYSNMGGVDNNSCVEGTVAGGLLGGALGGVLSKKDNWIWAIPSGMVAGSMIGCQVDGG
jgi:uncharacterized protein YcfJ